MGASKPPVIAVCGLPGSFSEAAAQSYQQYVDQEYDLEYLPDAAHVVAAMKDGAALGIVPIDNSVSGKVAEAEAIPESARKVETVAIPVRHQLLVKSGTNLADVRQVVSHEQALAQCAEFLAETLPKVKHVSYPDTAQAARDLAEGTLSEADAVLASQAAAERYGLEVLKADVQDSAENRTQFLVFALSK
jgi:prephenate dehydratase